MSGVHDTSVSASGGGLFTITIFGRNELVASLHRLSPDIEKQVKKEIKEAANKVKADASSYGGVLGKNPSGAYGGSFSLKDQKKGIRIISDDPGAGAIEFANAGAVYLRGRWAGRPFPATGDPKPKALIRSANEHEPEVLRMINEALGRACDAVRGA